jgi:hypothetical protein
MIDRSHFVCAALFLFLLLFELGPDSASRTLLAQDARAAQDEPAAADLDTPARLAADLAIEWLVSVQRPSGAWLGDVGFELRGTFEVTTSTEQEEAEDGGHLGVSALAGLAILEGRDAPTHAARTAAIERAVRFVLACAREDGSLWDRHSDFHSQALAVEFLAKVLLLAPDKDDIRRVLWDAVDVTLAAQSPSGGWNYRAFMPRSDVIVTGLTLRAMHAAARAGVEVPAASFDRAARFLESVRIVPPHPLSGGYCYRLRSDPARYSSATITGLAVEALVSERRLADAPLRESLEFIERAYGERTSSQLNASHFFGTTDRFFAARALRSASIPGTTAFAERIRGDVLGRQARPGRWIDNVGEVFATAAAVLTLVERD